VWNTIFRGDHQLSANNTYSVRWLRESSPQVNQIIGAVTPAANREESDVDQTVSVNVNTVLASTKVNTLRTTWTRENVAFANHCFNTNGRDQAACPPTLTFQTFTDQQSNLAQARIDDAIQLDETLAWFLPNRHGDHDIKFGAQYEYTNALNLTDDSLNGIFTFNQSNGPFNANDPRTYPDRFTIRVGGENRITEKIHYFAGFVQDKWRLNSRLTASLGLRYDLESMPIPETDDPLVTKAPVDKNNIAPRLGLTYDLNGGRSVVRGGYGRFFERQHLEQIGGLWNPLFSLSSIQNFPASGPDLNPRNGLFPTDPFLVNGPTINTALLNQRFPAGVPVQSAGPTWDNPDRSNPYTDEFTAGYERQLAGSLAVSADVVHQTSRSMLMSLNLNPNQRATPNVNLSPTARIGSPELTAARAQLLQTYPNLAPFTNAVNKVVNTGEIDYDGLMLQLKKRFSHNYSAQVSYTLGNARGNYAGAGTIPVSNFQVGQDMHLELGHGPTDNDIRHNFTVSGTALVPHTYGLNVSWVARALSGLPFSLTNGAVDPDLNGIQAEPLAAGTYTGAGASDNYTVKDYKSERNGARAPGFFDLDMRLGYRIPLSKQRRVEIAADIFNVTNHTNFAIPGGNQNAPTTFLVLTGYSTSYAPRKVQIGARIQF
jgi:hypothetical protein